jgi:two-component system sensor histidine kinase YesM
VIAYILPVSVLFIFISLSYRNNIIEKTEMLMEEELKNFTSFHGQKLDEAITISKKISYELVIEKAWGKYKAGNITDAQFYKEVIGNLKSKYYNDNRFVLSVFYLSDNPERLYYTSRETKSYIDNYIEKVQGEAIKITNQDTTEAQLKIIDGKIYIIRNLYTTRNYTKFGTLVVELDKNKLFDGLSLNKDYEFGFFLDDIQSVITYDKRLAEESRIPILNELQQEYLINTKQKMIKIDDNNYTGFLFQRKFDDYKFAAILVADKSVIYSELKSLMVFMTLILVVVIPVFIYMIYFIGQHITAPMGRMIKASREIEKGRIGMQVVGEAMPNEEFSYLMDSFNRMSSEVKYLFDYAYNEKLARKEAKIIALQSQINPHFLNNTLEMMNWQARMAGDIEVSKMIEALGTLLDYSMDRNNKKLIQLSEELRCADAYFYIISMRFGQRLRVEKDIDKELQQILVPQLILQPLLENAVVHGVENVKSGVIKLNVLKENDNVILQVTNTGKEMTIEDIDKVGDILDGKVGSITEEKGKHVSLGIRNVNERIKLIYGEEFGLTIIPIINGDTVETAATITIPFNMKIDTEKRTLLKTLLDKTD